MEQKDFILREIEKISVMLLGILGKASRNAGTEESRENFWNNARELLRKEEVLDLDYLVECSPEEFSRILSRDKGFDEKNIEMLADVLAGIYITTDREARKRVRARALDLYRYAASINKTYSFSRQEKMRKLEEEP